MSHKPIWSMTAVGLTVAVLGFVGCEAKRAQEREPGAVVQPVLAEPEPPKRDAPDPKTTTSATPTNPDDPIAKWPDPTVLIVLSGELEGYLEPCGCTDGQMGGLARRLDLIDKLSARKAPIALFDLGTLVKDPAAARGGLKQSLARFDTALKSLALMRYSAIGLSAEDLKLGVGEVIGHFTNLNETPTKIVSCNVSVKDQTGDDAPIQPSVRLRIGQVRIGVTSVLDPAELKPLADASDWLDAKPFKESLAETLADLETDTDVQILLVPGKPQWAKTLARANPGFDIVVGTSVYADPDAEPETINDGGTLLIRTGKRGKYVGVVGLFEDSDQKFRYMRIALNKKYKFAEPVRQLIEDYRSQMREIGFVEDFPKIARAEGAPGATFVGADTCKNCHPNTHARWAQTKHAAAFQALKNDKVRKNLEFDADCVSCHTTGFEYISGWRSETLTPALKGNQCENCHGPASRHVEAPDNVELRKYLSKPVENPDQTRFCLRCHDEDNSPHFDFNKYYGQIVHKKMDTYEDPKVHRGIKPAAGGGGL